MDTHETTGAVLAAEGQDRGGGADGGVPDWRILVLGGTGMLGLPVVRRLRADGYRVRVLSRSAARARPLLGAACEVAEGDVDDPAALAAALRDCQGVHLSLHGQMDPDLERRGAVNVARLAGPAGVRRITYLSAASVCEENCWFADTKARWEAEAALRGSGVPWSIFRCNFIMETLHRFVRGKTAVVPGRQPLRFHWIAAADFARMVARAFALPEAANRTFDVYGPTVGTLREALQVYCRIAHPEARIVQLPLWLLWVIAVVGRQTELRDALPLFRYLQKVEFRGNPEEANAVLGAATITLEEWSRQEAAGRAPVAAEAGAARS